MKIFLIILMLFTLISCNKKEKEILFLGSDICGYVSYLKEKNELINNTFVMKNGYISYLYSMIIKDAKDINTNLKLSDCIKNASCIYIQIGNDDFLRCIKNVDNKNIVDEDALNTQKELFSYYYFLLVEEIRDIYNGKILLLSPYYSLNYQNGEISSIDNSLNDFYEVVNEVSEYFNCKLIDIRSINLFIDEDEKLSNSSFSFIDKLIQNE